MAGFLDILQGVLSGMAGDPYGPRRMKLQRDQLQQQAEEFKLRQRISESQLKLHDMQVQKFQQDFKKELELDQPFRSYPEVPGKPGTEGKWEPSIPGQGTKPMTEGRGGLSELGKNLYGAPSPEKTQIGAGLGTPTPLPAPVSAVPTPPPAPATTIMGDPSRSLPVGLSAMGRDPNWYNIKKRKLYLDAAQAKADELGVPVEEIVKFMPGIPPETTTPEGPRQIGFSLDKLYRAVMGKLGLMKDKWAWHEGTFEEEPTPGPDQIWTDAAQKESARTGIPVQDLIRIMRESGKSPFDQAGEQIPTSEANVPGPNIPREYETARWPGNFGAVPQPNAPMYPSAPETDVPMGSIGNYIPGTPEVRGVPAFSTMVTRRDVEKRGLDALAKAGLLEPKFFERSKLKVPSQYKILKDGTIVKVDVFGNVTKTGQPSGPERVKLKGIYTPEGVALYPSEWERDIFESGGGVPSSYMKSLESIGEFGLPGIPTPEDVRTYSETTKPNIPVVQSGIGKKQEKLGKPGKRTYFEGAETVTELYDAEGKLSRTVRAPREKPEKPKMTLDEKKKMFANYNISRAKAPADPIRLEMIKTMKTLGIDVPVSLPEMTFEEFDKFITTGEMPKESPKLGERKPLSAFEGK